MGITIVLIVLAVQSLAAGSIWQLQLLALASVVLFCIQLTLSRYHARHGDPPPADSPTALSPSMRRARSRNNVFMRELTHDWTGLDPHVIKRHIDHDNVSAHPTQEPADEQSSIK